MRRRSFANGEKEKPEHSALGCREQRSAQLRAGVKVAFPPLVSSFRGQAARLAFRELRCDFQRLTAAAQTSLIVGLLQARDHSADEAESEPASEN